MSEIGQWVALAIGLAFVAGIEFEIIVILRRTIKELRGQRLNKNSEEL